MAKWSGKIVETISKVVGGTKHKKDKFAEEAKRDFYEEGMTNPENEWTKEKTEEIIGEFQENEEKMYLNLLCLNKGRHQGLENDVSPELMKPIKQSRYWKFGGSYCVNATQLAELRQFFVDNQEQILKNSKVSMKLFREKFADYAVDNPKMEKEV